MKRIENVYPDRTTTFAWPGPKPFLRCHTKFWWDKNFAFFVYGKCHTHIPSYSTGHFHLLRHKHTRQTNEKWKKRRNNNIEINVYEFQIALLFNHYLQPRKFCCCCFFEIVVEVLLKLNWKEHLCFFKIKKYIWCCYQSAFIFIVCVCVCLHVFLEQNEIDHKISSVKFIQWQKILHTPRKNSTIKNFLHQKKEQKYIKTKREKIQNGCRFNWNVVCLLLLRGVCSSKHYHLITHGFSQYVCRWKQHTLLAKQSNSLTKYTNVHNLIAYQNCERN